MTHLRKKYIVPAVSVVALLLPTASVMAQNNKPVAVISLSGVDELTADVAYLTQAAGSPGLARGMVMMLQPWTQGIDKTKPCGAVVTTDGISSMEILGFVPVTDLDQALAALEPQLGEPNDAGDGVFEFSDPVPTFVKQQGDWAFIANSFESLAELPANPVELLDGLNDKYDIAVRAYVSNVPEIYRALVKSNAQMALAELPDAADDKQNKVQRKLLQNWLSQIDVFFNETKSLTLGCNIDAGEQHTYFDLGMTALKGTSLAQRITAMNEVTSNFTGFLQPDAALQMHFASTMTQQDIDQVLPMLHSVKIKALGELDEDKDLEDDETRAAAQDLLSSVMDILLDTVAGGKLDGGAVLMLDSQVFTLAAGAYVADGTDLEQTVKKLVTLAEGEDAVRNVQWNAQQHAGVRLHTMSMPIPDEEARDVLGDEVSVVVGIGPQSGYLAVGTDCVELLKKILDTSADGVDKKVTSGQMTLSLAPILQFVASVDDSLIASLMADALKEVEGKDHIYIRSIPTPGGTISRVEVEEGVLRAIGRAYQIRNEAGLQGAVHRPAETLVGR